MNSIRWVVLGTTLAASLALAQTALADSTDLEQKVDTLSQQVDLLQQESAAQRAVAEYMNSKSRVHLAGYGSFTYTDPKNGNGSFTQAQFSPIFHYMYGDIALMESELEINNTPSGGTELDMEYAAVDIFLNDYAALFAGKFLSPLGQFRQNLHPTWVNKLPSMPLGFGHDGATPLNDVGAGLRGGFGLGGAWRSNYAVYIGNGPTLVTEVEDGETVFNMATEGSTTDADGKKVFGGRIGFLPPVPNTEFGISAAVGKLGTAAEADPAALFATEPLRDYKVFGGDAVYHWSPQMEFRAEYIQQQVGADAASLLHPDSLSFSAAYLQAAYQFGATPWETVIRWGKLDTPNEDDNRTQWAIGVNYLFSANVMAKLDYELANYDLAGKANDNRIQLQLAFGF